MEALFDDNKSRECFDILGFQMMALITGGGSEAAKKLGDAVEARANEIQTALTNIEEDYRLSFDFGKLSTYEKTYLEAALLEYPKLELKLAQLKKEIDCWRHLEKVHRIAELDKPPQPPNASEPPTGETSNQPPQTDPDPFNLDKIYDLAKGYFDDRAKKVEEFESVLELHRKGIIAELDKRKANDTVNLPPPSTVQQPIVNTTSVTTGVDLPPEQTLQLGGIFIYGGGHIHGYVQDGVMDLTPGNQTIDTDGKTGVGGRAGVVLPLAPNFGLGIGGRIDRFNVDTVRLNNQNGTSISTGGDANLTSALAEISALLRLNNGVTFRASGYAGRAWRNIDLKINGATALNFTDSGGAHGFGVGIGIPLTTLGFDTPNVCIGFGYDSLTFDEMDGFTPGATAINVSELEQEIFSISTSFRLSAPTSDPDEIFTDGFESGYVTAWSAACP